MSLKNKMIEYGGMYISNTGKGYDHYRIAGGNYTNLDNILLDDSSPSQQGGKSSDNDHAENFLISVIRSHNKRTSKVPNQKDNGIYNFLGLNPGSEIKKKAKKHLSLKALLFGGRKLHAEPTGSTNHDDHNDSKEMKKPDYNKYYQKIKGKGMSLANQLISTSTYEAETLE